MWRSACERLLAAEALAIGITTSVFDVPANFLGVNWLLFEASVFLIESFLRRVRSASGRGAGDAGTAGAQSGEVGGRVSGGVTSGV